MTKLTERMDAKKAAATSEEELAKLRRELDKQLLKKASTFAKHQRSNNTQCFWNLWSTNNEKGISNYFRLHGIKMGGNKGRGFVNIMKRRPRSEEGKDDEVCLGHIKTKDAKGAVAALTHQAVLNMASART